MRRLSAIMFTDMVGYSRLAQHNESLALDLLEEHRIILRSIFIKYEGNEIETAGDAFFVEFKSAVEAANCAIDIQTTLYNRNKSLPENNQIILRIGLHIGDVVYMDDKVHGDGVNIAARLEPLSKPGGICISEDVARQIRNKISFPVMKLGKGNLKNISLPMNVYCIVLPWLKTERFSRYPTKNKMTLILVLSIVFVLITMSVYWLSNNFEVKSTPGVENINSKYRLAVLPLNNISDDHEDEFFADGMTEELISTLSQIGGLNIIARTSIMKYKDADINIAAIGRELKVGTILEGSVRKIDNQARINVQLIDVSTQEYIWSEVFTRELKDIFGIQSEIAQKVAKELKVRLISSERQLLDKIYTENTDAFREYFIGKHFLNSKTSKGIETSIIYFERSIKHDPGFSLPYANMAYAYALIGGAGYGNIPMNVAADKAREYVNKALEIDNTLAEAHAALGYIKFRIDWDWSGAEASFRKAISLKPNFATAHEWYALFLSIHIRLDEALVEMERALELDPLSASVNTGLARIYSFRHEWDKAISQCQKTLEIEPNYAEAYFSLGLVYNQKKQYKESIEALEKANEFSNHRPVVMGMLGSIYAESGDIDSATKILNELEISPMNDHKLFATCFIKDKLGGYEEEIFNNMARLLKNKYGVLIFLKVEPTRFKFKRDPRIIKLIDETGIGYGANK